MKKKATKNSPAKKDFLVVGLGASAGGVKALQDFFATMPPNSGMAFVAILHLSPEHESNLANIIQAQTEMKVTQVTETVKVEPNNVYVIPPNQQLEMVDGVIRPVKSERPHGHRIAIDVFFRTMAEAYERNAVCIVLSGTGTDGTLGLKRVKESNGFAIVQDPEDAEYDSMPRSAINTQLADWVLPIKQMPEKLLGFKESSERLHLTNGADANKIAEEIHADDSLREILTLLRVRTGHDFSNYKTPTLIRRIARHLQIHELEDIPSYLELLRQHPNEIQSLLKNLLINVTNFFRDKDAFFALESNVIPGLFAGKNGKDTVRVWSCGCASGEEPYSLTILLHEYADTLPDPPKIQVFASDVDDEAIQEAREHRYPESIEADVSPERLKRFFIKEGAFYRVKKELRETVLFAPHNVLRDPPFSRLDLVSCRNLLIYLNRETQERVLQIFHFALVSGGYLFLGSSETAENQTTYTPIDKKHRIYARRNAPISQASLPMMPVVGRWEVRVPERKTTTQRDRVTTFSDIHYRLLENYAPSSVLVNQDFDIVYLSGTANRFLRFNSGEPSRNLLKAVLPDLLPDLRAALFTAQREHKPSEFPNVRVRVDGEETVINLIVRAVDVPDETSDFLLVIFEERNSPSVQKIADSEIQKIADKDEAMEAVLRRLEEDLQRTKEHLRFTIEQHETTVEELKASNEELQAINEELRSASEELETSKEELQSVNEELTTVNHELKDKIDETSRINSDLSNLMAATDIATIFLDKNLRIKRYTPPVEDFFNITKADIGRPLEHFTHKLRYEELAKDAERVLRKLTPLEHEITDKDGRYYLARFAPYRTLDDRIDGVVLNFIDVTKNKEVQERIRTSEERLQGILSQTLVGICQADLSGRLSFVNQKFLEIFGYDAEAEAIGKNWSDFTTDEFTLTNTRLFDRLVKKGVPFEIEKQMIRKDGAIIWARVSVSGLKDADGKVVSCVAVVNEITARKQAEADLRKSEEKYRTLFDSIDDGFCIIEVLFDDTGAPVDYHFLETNPAFVRQTGIENSVGRRMRDIAPQHEKYWFEIYGQVALTGEPIRFERGAKELGNRFYDVYAFRVGAPEEHKVAIIFNDIAPRKQTERELTRTNQLLRATFDNPFQEIQLFKAVRDEHSGEIIDFEWLMTNKQWNDHWGERSGQRMLTENPGVIEAGLFDLFKQVTETGVPVTQEQYYAYEQFSGWYWLNAAKVEDGFLLSTLDITERKTGELALRESEEKYRSLFDSIDEGFHSIELIFNEAGEAIDYRYLEVNQVFERHTGLKNVVGKLGSEVSPNTESYWLKAYGDVAQTGEPHRIENYNEYTGRWYSAYASRVGDAGSRKVTVVFDDITERKQREQQQEFLLRLSDTLRPLSDANEIETVACRILGEHLGAHRVYYVEVFDSEGTTRVRKQYLRGGAASIAGEYTIEAFDWTAAPLRRGEAVVVSDVYHSDVVPPEYVAAMEAVQQMSVVLVPLIKEGEWVGVLTVGDDATRDWKETEVELARETLERMWAAAERARAEESLRDSESRLQLIANHIPDLLWASEPDGSTNWYNQRWLEYTGQSFEEATGWGWVDAIHPDDREGAARRYRKAVENNELLRQEQRIRRYDGEYRWFVVSAFPLKDESGKVIKMYGAATDIHESRLMLEAVGESEERMRIAVEAAQMATWDWDLKTDKVIWNERHFLLLGMKPNDKPQSSATFFNHVHPDDQESVSEKLKKAIETDTDFEAEFCIVREDGTSRWMEGYGHVVAYVNGKPIRMSGVMSDITERKNAEDAVRKSEERLQLILKSITDYAVITTDTEGIITSWNTGAENTFGWTEAEAVGSPSAIIFTLEDQKAGIPKEEMQTALKDGIAEDERWHVRKDGSRFFASGTVSPITNGKFDGFVKITSDQTERMAAEKALQEREMLQKLVGAQEDERKRIARDMHDELGQQLTALRLNLEHLKNSCVDNDELCAKIDDAQLIAKSIDDGVDFLAWELRPAALDDLGLFPALEKYILEWSHYAGIKGELLFSSLKKTRLLPEVETNFYRIVQEALNNVHKHAGATNVEVQLEKRSEMIILLISDNGQGFNPEEKINQNKGIGLIGMRERALLIGGSFEIESAPGKGTTIHTRIPLANAKAEKKESKKQ